MVPATPDRAALERLHLAVVALLEPLIDETPARDPHGLLARLDAGLTRAEEAASGCALPVFARFLSLSRGFLDLAIAARGWDACREAIENWVGSLVAFSAGHLPGDGASVLIGDLMAVSAGEPIESAEAGERIVAALRALAPELARHGQGEAPSVASPPVPGDGWSAGREGLGQAAPRASIPAAPTVARDELEMLAQALEGIRGELEEGADGDAAGHWPATDDERLELAAERLNHWANAAGYVGLDALAEVARRVAESLGRQVRRADPEAAGANVRPVATAFWTLPRIKAVGAALAQLLRHRAMPQVRALCALLSVPASLAPMQADWLNRALTTVIELKLVESRQVEPPPTTLDAEDVSLAIPSDIDPQLLGHLLRELPPLTNALGSAVAGMLANEPAAVADAQRLAHTLKGSANTAGIRGIATLAHLLEDLLSLLARRRGTATGEIGGLLEQAADGLAEMAEALAARTDPPAGALALCERIAAAVNRLIDAVDDESSATGDPMDDSDLRVEAALDNAPTQEGRDPAAAGLDRSPADLDAMLRMAAEASVLMAQAQDQLARLQETRRTLRKDSERLQDLAAELDRVVDLRKLIAEPAARDGPGAFDAEHFDDLQTVSRRIVEAGADARLSDRQLDQQMAAMAEAMGQLERVQGDLHDALLTARMVPVAGVVPRLQRALRQAARMAGRAVDLRITGADVLVDARLLQSLIDPLTHLLRNAVDHGIEDEAQRLLSGKPARGSVSLVFEQAARELRIVCTDDGRGLDHAAVLARARHQGIAEASLEDPALITDLVLRPGFSTRASATQLSGRGIGMDLVRRALDRLHGSIALQSEPGRGLRVTLSMPLAVSGLPVLVLRSRALVLALSVRQVAQILPIGRLSQDAQGGEQLITEEGSWPIHRLDESLGLPPGSLRQPPENAPGVPEPPPLAEVLVLVRGNDGRRAALIAPEPAQTRSVVLRPMPAWMPPLAGMEGACVLGDGSAAAVIDLPGLLAALADPVGPASGLRGVRQSPVAPAAQAPLCLVVDDSLSVRRTTEQFLRDLGLRTDAAGDGVDALARMRRQRPDLLILDLEMPRMNGIDLVRSVRAEPQWRDLPVIMITSRASVRHRQLALATGVNVFLTKPYVEDDLAAHVRACLEPGSMLG